MFSESDREKQQATKRDSKLRNPCAFRQVGSGEKWLYWSWSRKEVRERVSRWRCWERRGVKNEFYVEVVLFNERVLGKMGRVEGVG